MIYLSFNDDLVNRCLP